MKKKRIRNVRTWQYTTSTQNYLDTSLKSLRAELNQVSSIEGPYIHLNHISESSHKKIPRNVSVEEAW